MQCDWLEKVCMPRYRPHAEICTIERLESIVFRLILHWSTERNNIQWYRAIIASAKTIKTEERKRWNAISMFVRLQNTEKRTVYCVATRKMQIILKWEITLVVIAHTIIQIAAIMIIKSFWNHVISWKVAHFFHRKLQASWNWSGQRGISRLMIHSSCYQFQSWKNSWKFLESPREKLKTRILTTFSCSLSFRDVTIIGEYSWFRDNLTWAHFNLSIQYTVNESHHYECYAVQLIIFIVEIGAYRIKNKQTINQPI